MRNNSLYLSASAILLALMFAGCASSTNRADRSGFLGDYSMLKENDMSDRAQYGYLDRTANFAHYTKIMLDPVELWIGEDADLSEAEQAELQNLADYFFETVHASLSEDYTIVKAPGADVMQLRIALTDVDSASPAMNTVSTVLPVGLVISSGKKLATGSHAYVGKAGVEVELLDSATGKRIGAAIDERAGGKNPFNGRWGDAKKAFDYWADLMRERLQRLTRASRMKSSMQNVYI